MHLKRYIIILFRRYFRFYSQQWYWNAINEFILINEKNWNFIRRIENTMKQNVFDYIAMQIRHARESIIATWSMQLNSARSSFVPFDSGLSKNPWNIFIALLFRFSR